MVEEQPQEHLKFQSTLLHGERPTIRQPLPWWTRFNPRSRTGATGIQTAGREMHEGFNPRFRTGSDLSGLYLSIGISRFNPRSRTGSDVVSIVPEDMTRVSIHAPARGATLSAYASATGVTFQSTLPHGERPAPVSVVSWYINFNPRSRTGSDLPREADRGRPMGFQSTLPHGERLFWSVRSMHHHYFNPRSRTGSDDIPMTTINELKISIHAPARGATPNPFSPAPWITISIHAPARGATMQPKSASAGQSISIHAPARGATDTRGNTWYSEFISIHAPARGATVCPDLPGGGGRYFNPRSRTGSDTGCSTPRWPEPSISIHAPARGATPIYCRQYTYNEFQSTLPHGERLPSMIVVYK